VSEGLENRVEKIENRLDRVEILLERIVLAWAEDRDDWKARMKAFESSMESMKLRQEELSESVTVLVHTVDEWIRNNPRNGGTGPLQKR
jgi:hypothetical protein